MFRKSIIYTLFTCLLFGCALLSKNRQLQRIEFEYPADAQINYANRIPFDIIAVYDNGSKNISKKSDLLVSSFGATYKDGYLYIDSFPLTLASNEIVVKADYMHNEKKYTDSIRFAYNYKGDLHLPFMGRTGLTGKDARNRTTPLILRSGKDGEDGENGLNGEDGADLNVKIWKEDNSQFYIIKVNHTQQNKTFYYRYLGGEQRLIIDVSGGPGGKGGDGGDGGNGKDGVIKDGESTPPGDGGNGGNGANGGTGGNGGSVRIYLHPNAKEIKDKINVINVGGIAGAAGVAGKLGEPGDAAESQEEGKIGVAGKTGLPGKRGNNGKTTELMIETFDVLKEY